MVFIQSTALNDLSLRENTAQALVLFGTIIFNLQYALGFKLLKDLKLTNEKISTHQLFSFDRILYLISFYHHWYFMNVSIISSRYGRTRPVLRYAFVEENWIYYEQSMSIMTIGTVEILIMRHMLFSDSHYSFSDFWENPTLACFHFFKTKMIWAVIQFWWMTCNFWYLKLW